MKRLDKREIGLGLLLGGAYTALLLLTAKTQGYARDEGFYFASSEVYAAWFELLVNNPRLALSQPQVDAAWQVNREHPSLMKSLFALSWWLLYKKTHLFAHEGTAFRFPAMAIAGLGLTVVCWWGTQVHGRLAGIVAALLFGFVPTTFYHAHLNCFDVPIAVFWLLCAWVHHRALIAPSAGRALIVGGVFGACLATKHNSWFLPFYATTLWFVLRGPWLKSREDRRAPWALVAMATMGPLLLWGLWPWLWRDPIVRFLDYAKFHLHHDYYNMEFLGTTYHKPPFPRAYAWVTSLATLPVAVPLFAIAGLVAHGSKELRDLMSRTFRPDLAPVVSWALGVAVNYAPWLSTNTPIFGGTKHWLAAYPFLSLLAGSGVAWAAKELAARWALIQSAAVQYALAALVSASSVVHSLRMHPWGLSGYMPLVGGSAGAATLGLGRSFWGYTTGSVIDVLNERVPPYGTVYIHDTAYDAFRMLQRDRKLRRDIRAVGSPAMADAALYHHEQHMAGVEGQIWVAMETVSPVVVRGLDGVPIVWVYLRHRHRP